MRIEKYRKYLNGPNASVVLSKLDKGSGKYAGKVVHGISKSTKVTATSIIEGRSRRKEASLASW